METSQNGFIALISILILSSVLLASTISLAQFGIASRFFVLNLEQKAGSQKLAEACVELMRVKVYNNPAYTSTTETMYGISDSECAVLSVNPISASSPISTIQVSASAGTASAPAVTNLEADIVKATGSTTRVVEIGSL